MLSPLRALVLFISLGSGASAATDWILGPTFAEQTSAEILGNPAVRREGGRWFTHFDGQHDGFIVPSDPLTGARQFTIEVLLRPAATGPAEQRFLHLEGGKTSWITMETRLAGGSWALDSYLKSDTDKRKLLDPALKHDTAKWHWAALRYDGQTMTSFVDGQRELAGPVNFPELAAGRSSVGVRLNRVYWFAGDIAEIRIIDEALDPDELRR